jgi:hypothetical protein
VQVRLDGGDWKFADGLENWTLTLETILLQDGEHTVYARASDANQSSENASVKILVRNPDRPVSSGFDLMCLVMIIITAGMAAIVVIASRAKTRKGRTGDSGNRGAGDPVRSMRSSREEAGPRVYR